MTHRPIRVVQVSFHADTQRRDGETLLQAWPTLSAVAAGAARAGVDVTVVQAAHSNETIRRNAVDFHFVADGRARRTNVVERVVSLAPDLVHVQGIQYARAMRALTRALRRVPIVVQDHGGIPPRGWRRAALSWAFRPLAGATFTAREQAAPWIEDGVLRSDLPVFEVVEGSSTFTPGDQSEARRTTGLHGDPCLLWTSRLDANKDPLMMLDAVERAVQRLADLRLWCCFGEAPMLATVGARIAQSDALRDRVMLLGTRPHDSMEALYRAADFYLQTSHREGSGFSLLEAMSCGTTPIVTDIPPTRRLVADAGSLTPPGDASAMADALVAWAGRDRSSLRDATRERFESALTYDSIGVQLRSAYESVASTCPEAAAARYYDSIATIYDAQVDAVGSNRLVRNQFLDRVSSLVRPGGRIVDFGCGTGVDTDWYANHGHPVVAYDISKGMTGVLRERCAEHIASGRVSVVAGEVEQLWDLLERSGPADAVVANFAVFNHISDLDGLFQSVTAHLAPGAFVATQMLNAFYWRDVAQRWWWRSAARSLGSGAVEFTGPDTTTYRHFSRSVVRAATAAGLTLVERLGSAPGPRKVAGLAALGAVASQFSIFVFQRR